MEAVLDARRFGTDDQMPHEESLSLTKRSKVVKIAFSGKDQNALGKVSRDIYGYEDNLPEVAAVDQNWTTTDEGLYGPARSIYDSIVKPFLQEPKVYRFESTKQRIWSDHERIRLEQLPPPEPEPEPEPVLGQFKTGRKRNKQGKVVKVKSKALVAIENEQKRIEAVRLMDPLETYLDPFEIQKPWIEKKNDDGSIYYFNEDTKETTNIFPGEAWLSRLQLLDQLVPKDDFSGYDYKETAEERVERLKAQSAFARKLQDEIRRRLEAPTELEQVEDALFDIVDSIVKTDERQQQLKRRREKARLNRLRNPVARDYEMIPLKVEHKEADAPEVMLVTDIEFTDVIITTAGLMLPLTAPTGVLRRHEEARELRARVLEEIQKHQKKLWVRFGGEAFLAAARELKDKARNPLRPLTAPGKHVKGGSDLHSSIYESMKAKSSSGKVGPPVKQMSLYENARLILAIARNDPGKAFLKVAEGIESSITGRPPPAEGEDSKLRRGLKALNLDTTAVLAQSKDAVHTGMAGLLQLQSQIQARATPLHNKLIAMSPALRRLEERGGKLKAAGEDYWKEKMKDWAPALQELQEVTAEEKLKFRLMATGVAEKTMKGVRGVLNSAIEKGAELKRILEEDSDGDNDNASLADDMSVSTKSSMGKQSLRSGGSLSTRRTKKSSQPVAKRGPKSLIVNPNAMTQKLEHIDAVIVTVVALLDAPPHWVRTPLKSLKEDLEDGAAAIAEAVKRKFGAPLNPLRPMSPSKKKERALSPSPKDSAPVLPSSPLKSPANDAASPLAPVGVKASADATAESSHVPMVGVGGRPGIYTYTQWREKHCPKQSNQDTQDARHANAVDAMSAVPERNVADGNESVKAEEGEDEDVADVEREEANGDDEGHHEDDEDEPNEGDHEINQRPLDENDVDDNSDEKVKPKKALRQPRVFFNESLNSLQQPGNTDAAANISSNPQAHTATSEKTEKAAETTFIDTSHRVAFEEQLIRDMANATCLPPENISIEQIRRLEVNSHVLLELQKRNQQIYESLQIAQEEERRTQAEKEFERMAQFSTSKRGYFKNGFATSGNVMQQDEGQGTCDPANELRQAQAIAMDSEAQLQKGLSLLQQDIETRSALNAFMDELVVKGQGDEDGHRHHRGVTISEPLGPMSASSHHDKAGAELATGIANGTAVEQDGRACASVDGRVGHVSGRVSDPSDRSNDAETQQAGELSRAHVNNQRAHFAVGTDSSVDSGSGMLKVPSQSEPISASVGALRQSLSADSGGGEELESERKFGTTGNDSLSNQSRPTVLHNSSLVPIHSKASHHDSSTNEVINRSDTYDTTFHITRTGTEVDTGDLLASYDRQHLEAAEAIKDAKLMRDRPPSEVVSLSSDVIEHIVPRDAKMPEYFKLGLSNPQEQRMDPSNWQAFSLRELTAAERRAYRIQALRRTSKEHSLKGRMQQELVNLVTSIRYNLMDLREDARIALEEGIVTAAETLQTLRALRHQLGDSMKLGDTVIANDWAREPRNGGTGADLFANNGVLRNTGAEVYVAGGGSVSNGNSHLRVADPGDAPQHSAFVETDGRPKLSSRPLPPLQSGMQVQSQSHGTFSAHSHQSQPLEVAPASEEGTTGASPGIMITNGVPQVTLMTVSSTVPEVADSAAANPAVVAAPAAAADPVRSEVGPVAVTSTDIVTGNQEPVANNNTRRQSGDQDQNKVIKSLEPGTDIVNNPSALPCVPVDEHEGDQTTGRRALNEVVTTDAAAPDALSKGLSVSIPNDGGSGGSGAHLTMDPGGESNANKLSTISPLVGGLLSTVPRVRGQKQKELKKSQDFFPLHEANDEFADFGLVGCEISFSIFITEEQREGLGLQDMEAEDIAVLISQQLFDAESPLRAGKYSRYFIDARYKLMNKRRVFSAWEDFWVHSIHPCFFGYSTAKFTKRKRPNLYDPNAPEDVRNRVAPGLLMVNPIDVLPREGRLRFIDLDGEDRWRSARLGLGLRLKNNMDAIGEPDEKLTDFTHEALLLADQQEQLLQLMHAVDHMDDDSSIGSSVVMKLIQQMDNKKLKLYRPNMLKITEDDVENLKRMKRRFERQYRDKMRLGLVDGVRLSPQQYEALKALETAERIYRSARQWLNRVQRDKGERSPYDAGPIKLTTVSTAEYQEWVKEIAKEEFEKLRRLHFEAERVKELRQQEVDLKKMFGAQRAWLLRKLSECHPQPPTLAYAMQQEFGKIEALNNKMRNGELSEVQVEKIKRKRLAETMRIISEEKRTRKLFGIILQWVARVRTELRKEGRKSGAQLSSMARDVNTNTIRMLRAIEKEWRGDDELELDDSSVAEGSGMLTPVESLGAAAGGAAGGTGGELSVVGNMLEYDSADDESFENVMVEGSMTSRLPSETGTGTAAGTAAESATRSLLTRVRKVQLLAFLDIARKLLLHEERELRRERLRKDKQAKAASELERRRWELLVEEEKKRFSDGGTSRTREELMEAERHMEALLSAPPDVAEDELGPPPPQVDPIFMLTEEEMITVRNLAWIGALNRSPPLMVCLRDMPTIHEGAFARDELIQFASIMVELEPVHSRVTNELAKKRAATLAEAREKRRRLQEIERELRRQRDENNAEQIAMDEDATEAEREAARAIVAKKREAAAADALKNLREEEAEKRRKRRENAWVQAHQHRFITLPDVPPFCIICKQRTHEYWVDARKTEEKHWKVLLDTYTEQVLSEYADKVHKLLEKGIKVAEFRNSELPPFSSPGVTATDTGTLLVSAPTSPGVKFDGIPDSKLGSREDGSRFGSETKPVSSSNDGGSRSRALKDEGSRSRALIKSKSNINLRGVVLPPPLREDHITEALNIMYLGPSALPQSVRKAGISLWTPKGKPIPLLVKAQEDIAREARIQAVMNDSESLKAEGEAAAEGEGGGDGGNSFQEISGVSVSQKSTKSKEQQPKPLGLMIRMWNWEDEHRGVFLGQVVLDHEIMLDPPKGMRTYRLRPNSQCAAEAAAERLRMQEIQKQIREARGEEEDPEDAAREAEREQKRRNMKVQGTLTVKVKAIKRDKETKEIQWWRVDIIRAHNLPVVDPFEITSAYCEIFWKGPAEKVDLKMKQILLPNWVPVGKTKRRDRTTDPVFSKLEGSSLDLPPIWSFGGADERGGALTGQWVARNYVPPKEVDQNNDNARTDGNKRLPKLRTLALAVLHLLALRKSAAATIAEVRRLREIRSHMMAAEEVERQCMGEEEHDMRCVNMEEELTRCKPYLETQVIHAKNFAQLLSLVQGPSQQLSRLVFLMASTMEAGGMNVICRDPATGRRVNAMVTPVLYPEDEAEMKRYMSALLGRQHPILLRVLDFSVNQIRGFTHCGYTGVDERVAIAVVDNCEGITLSAWLHQHRGKVSDEQFKAILIQVLEGLAALHADGLIHRNLHTDCVLVEPDDAASVAQEDDLLITMSDPTESEVISELSQDKTPSSTPNPLKQSKSRRAVTKRPKLRGRAGMHYDDGPMVKIGDYWFLQNPRAAGCVYSMGRADWGAPAKATAPPEAKNGHGKISPASDVYAFGMCVIYWAYCADVDMGQDKEKATMKEKRAKKADGRIYGQDLARANLGVPMSPAAAADPVRSLSEILPKRWGKWLHMLLRMCLPKDPRHRASSEELASFLKEIEL